MKNKPILETKPPAVVPRTYVDFYDQRRTQWPDQAEFRFDPTGGHQILVFRRSPETEIGAWREPGPVEICFHAESLLTAGLAWRFSAEGAWMLCGPWSWFLDPGKWEPLSSIDPRLHPETPLTISLVGGDGGAILAERVVALPRKFAYSINERVRLMRLANNKPEYQAMLRQQFANRFKTGADLARVARVKCECTVVDMGLVPQRGTLP